MKTKPLEQKIEEILAYYESDGSNITMPKTVEAISNLVEEEVKKALESVRDTFNLDTEDVDELNDRITTKRFYE